MSDSFYTNATQWGNKILFRGVSDGQRIESKDDFRPTLYTKTPKETGFKTLFGEHLLPNVFDDINEAKSFVKRYEDVDGFEIFGNTWFQYQMLAEKYPDDIQYDPTLVKIVSVDIETATEYGFPDVQQANEEILLITIKNRWTKQIITFGTREFDVTKIKHFDPTNYTYHKSRNEVEMLKAFLKFWTDDIPDVVTGWFIRGFDIPYIVNRIGRIMPDNTHVKLSPWRAVQEKMIVENNREMQVYDIIGVSTLDYLEVYKKFTPSKKQESYKLNYIAEVELGKNKLENPYETFKEFYTNDFQLFVEYNVVDTLLVDELEDKMRLLELVFLMAYRARCNFNDIFSPVRMWDCLIYNELLKHNIAPPQPQKLPRTDIVGAYVRNPPPGRYQSVVSMDATSLYPRIMLQCNMSPETLIKTPLIAGATVEGFLNKEYDMSEAKANNVAVAVNGFAFNRRKQGFFPKLVESMFNERVTTKKKQIEAEKKFEKTKDAKYKDDAKRYKMEQEGLKILLNSLFGASANPYFRFFSTAIAEGITMTGQYIIQQVASDIDVYLNKVCETDGLNYVFYCDTDSNYVTLNTMANKFFPDAKGSDLIDILDTICKEKLSLVIEKSCVGIAEYQNAYKNTTEFKREIIADQAIFTVKKRYALNIWDSEGVRFAEPKLKITGMESQRSSTPAWVRGKFKEAVKICLVGTEEELQAFVKTSNEEYTTLPVEKIAFPKGVNGLDKYAHDRSIYAKGAPIHVRASLLYNYMITERKLLKKYETVKNGDKMKFTYLIEENPTRENIIGWLGILPPELDLHRFVDYTLMWEKTFLKPVESVLDAIGWSSYPKATLSVFYEE